MEGTESADRAKFFPHAAEYVRSFVFDDVESSASVLFLDDCVPHFTIINLTGFLYFSITGAVKRNIRHIVYENHIFFQGHGFLGCVGLRAVVEKCQMFKVSCRLSIYSSLKIYVFRNFGTCDQIV